MESEDKMTRGKKYYDSHKDDIKTKAKTKYDPEAKAKYYKDKKEAILKRVKDAYYKKKAETNKKLLEEAISKETRDEKRDELTRILNGGGYTLLTPKTMRRLIE